MVEDTEQAIAIWWIVDADGFTSTRECIVDKAGRLMAEAIVNVAPGWLVKSTFSMRAVYARGNRDTVPAI